MSSKKEHSNIQTFTTCSAVRPMPMGCIHPAMSNPSLTVLIKKCCPFHLQGQKPPSHFTAPCHLLALLPVLFKQEALPHQQVQLCQHRAAGQQPEPRRRPGEGTALAFCLLKVTPALTTLYLDLHQNVINWEHGTIITQLMRNSVMKQTLQRTTYLILTGILFISDPNTLLTGVNNNLIKTNRDN